MGRGDVSSQVTWDQGGQVSTTQKEGFQVSKGGISKGNWQEGLARGCALTQYCRSVCMYHNIV
jgi:hypothetical protein